MTNVGERLEQDLAKPENIGQRITFARMRAKESKLGLARKIGISDGAVWQWENNKTRPSSPNLKRLAIGLKVRLAWLESGNGEMAATPEATVKLKALLDDETLGELKTIGPDGMDMSGRLRFAMSQAGMTVADLATATGYGVSTVGFALQPVDSKTYRKPNSEKLIKFAKALHVNVNWLNEGAGVVAAMGDVAPPPTTIASRLRAAMVWRGISRTELAIATGLAASCLHGNLAQDEHYRKPMDSTLVKYCKALNVPMAWLRDDNGTPPVILHDYDGEGIAARIRQYFAAHPEKTKAEIAKGAGINPTTISAYITPIKESRKEPLPHIIGNLAKSMDVNLNWLWSGIGPMEKQKTPPACTESDSPAPEPVPDAQERVSEDEAAKIAAYSVGGREVPEETIPVKVVHVSETDSAALMNQLLDAKSRRDKYRAKADDCQDEVDLLLNRMAELMQA